jgi:hypothetical protein
MERRGFLLGLGAALAAPAIVKAESLMKLWVPPAADFSTDYLLIKSTERFAFGWADWRVMNDPVFMAGMCALKDAIIDNIYNEPGSTGAAGLIELMERRV